MECDPTPKSLEKYFENRLLGKLNVDIPGCGLISADLNYLYRDGTNLPSFEEQTKPENIEAIVVYGSVLYKHFPPKTIIEKRKKYHLFGPEVRKEIIQRREMPGDFDIMILMRRGLTVDKVIIPKPKSPNNSYVESAAQVTKTRWDNGGSYGSYIETKSGANLHVTYRSVQQLLNGLGNGDTVSESVVRYGLPIVGRERFAEIVRNITSPQREPLHRVMWREDLKGKLQGWIE